MRVFFCALLPLLTVSFGFVPPCSYTIRNPELSRCRLSAEPSSDYGDTPPPSPKVKCPNCDLCDGSGRIMGGIGLVLPWWPIKAYRPCPNFIEQGGKYIRTGQPLDEIAFGRDSKYNKEN
mmetsp:Transcript_26182/g.38719  ORF Transcript_26182/g.38719 Transcript_26182/m.38719 type:complete len:120 (+) Transcript_26182:250-609(+)